VKLHVDADHCTGHGRCYSLAPELFVPDDDDGHGIVVGDGEVVGADQEAAARLAVGNCPERAITLEP
jgi:ferredoxin